jgi:hypothetical protein
MRPTVGRMVHYVSYGTPGGEYTSQCRAAIVTAVNGPNERNEFDPESGDVDLCVLNPEGFFFNKYVPYDEGHRGGSWHWPERED